MTYLRGGGSLKEYYASTTRSEFYLDASTSQFLHVVAVDRPHWFVLPRQETMAYFREQKMDPFAKLD